MSVSFTGSADLVATGVARVGGLIVETGTGLSDAESYAGYVEVTAILTKYISPTELATWTGLADTEKERHIRLGTIELDCNYGPKCELPKEKCQSLVFPLRNSTCWDCSIPTEVKESMAYLAWKSSTGDLGSGGGSCSSEGAESESVKFGGFSVSTSYASSAPTVTKFDFVTCRMRKFRDTQGTIRN